MSTWDRPAYTEADVDTALTLLRGILLANRGKDLRIAQVIGNLGDNYYREDQDYIAYLAKCLTATVEAQGA